MGAVLNVLNAKRRRRRRRVRHRWHRPPRADGGRASPAPRPLSASIPNRLRRELAKNYGATHVIDPTNVDVVAEIKKIVLPTASTLPSKPQACPR